MATTISFFWEDLFELITSPFKKSNKWNNFETLLPGMVDRKDGGGGQTVETFPLACNNKNDLECAIRKTRHELSEKYYGKGYYMDVYYGDAFERKKFKKFYAYIHIGNQNATEMYPYTMQ